MEYERMRSLISATERRIYRAWSTFREHVLADNSEEEITSAIGAGQIDIALVGVDDEAGRLAIGWHAAYIAAGQATAKWLGEQLASLDKRDVAKKLPVFDPADPPAAQWAAKNKLDLLREITGETRDMIRQVLIDGARAGTSPMAQAREIRQSIGLTAYQRQIVENYRRELIDGRYAAALRRENSHGRSDLAIAAAAKSGKPLTQAQIDLAVERYRHNMIGTRARAIAQTEGLRIAHQGSEELYRQAVERGDIFPEQLERTWIHSHRKKGGKTKGGKGRGGGPRPFHLSMHGQQQPFGEPFISGIGGRLRYPGDPEASAEETVNCACSISTRVRGSGDGPDRPGVGGRTSAVADAEALEEEMALLEEESAAAMAEAEQLALEQELTVVPETVVDDLVEPELGGPRIGRFRIAGETEIDEIDALNDLRPAPRAPAPEPAQLATDPYRSPGITGDRLIEIDKPAPVGFDAVEWNGELYYRHKITGRSYTPAQFAERADATYTLELTGPNKLSVQQFDGFDPLEVKTRASDTPELRYRSQKTGQTYTPTDMVDGYMAGAEEIMTVEAKRPGILRRIFDRLWL